MLLTRLPLTPKCPLDLHVLSLPPAFVLSQDQTLKFETLCFDPAVARQIWSLRTLTRSHEHSMFPPKLGFLKTQD